MIVECLGVWKEVCHLHPGCATFNLGPSASLFLMNILVFLPYWCRRYAFGDTFLLPNMAWNISQTDNDNGPIGMGKIPLPSTKFPYRVGRWKIPRSKWFLGHKRIADTWGFSLQNCWCEAEHPKECFEYLRIEGDFDRKSMEIPTNVDIRWH